MGRLSLTDLAAAMHGHRYVIGDNIITTEEIEIIGDESPIPEGSTFTIVESDSTGYFDISNDDIYLCNVSGKYFTLNDGKL